MVSDFLSSRGFLGECYVCVGWGWDIRFLVRVRFYKLRDEIAF